MIMKRHPAYLKYILRHKWFVFIAGRKMHVSIWQLLMHDMSKFRPSEWFQYAQTFYALDGAKQYIETEEFNYAWNAHQKRNKHHWQYWVLIQDDNGQPMPLRMPDKYTFEMVADWAGAGKAITGKWEVKEWYAKNKDKIILHPRTRRFVEEMLNYYF